MGKLAQDAVFRIFDYLKEEIDNIDDKEITKQFLLKAFLLGKSNLKTWKKFPGKPSTWAASSLARETSTNPCWTTS